MKIRIFDPRQETLSDDHIRSFLTMMAAPDQTEWDYEASPTLTLEPVTDEQVQSFRAHFLPNADNTALWAQAHDAIVGMVGINRYTAAHQTHSAELGVGVAKTYQQQGLGHRLVMAIIVQARKLGLRRLEAYCLAENRAVTRLLEKSGFVQEGIRRGAILKQGELRDERIFGLLLD